MTEERRSARRARIAGVRVTYESAAGERIDAHSVDLSRGGLFVRTARPLGVGKRIAVEITVIGEPAPWSALGRVVWVREKGEGDTRPPGMGVKLIDVDDAVVEAIDRMVETREPTEPGVGEPAQVTLEPPHVREPSIPIDLVAKRSDPPPSARRARVATAEAPEPANRGRAGSSHWLVLVALLAVAGVAAYVLFDGIVRVPPRVAPIPAAAPAAPSPPSPAAASPAAPPAPETVSAPPPPVAAAASSSSTAAAASAAKRSTPAGASPWPAAPSPGRSAPSASKKAGTAAPPAENPY